MVAGGYQSLRFSAVVLYEIDRGRFIKLRLWQRVFPRWGDMDFRISRRYR